MRSLLFAGIVLISGCGSGIPLGGQTAEGEQFVGSMTTRGRDYGPMNMSNGSDVACDGIWQLDSQRLGSLTFSCTDGRTGTAELAVGDAAAGTMKGMLGGKPFAGTFETSPL